MSINPLNDISKVYLEQVSESSHLETDMKKRGEENEKAIEDMKKTKAHKDMVAAARKKFDEALDPVGQENTDIDNDGDTDSNDKYLHNRRRSIGKAIAKKRGKNVKEGFSNWRQDLAEVMDDTEANQKIKEKKVNNKIKINPKLGEAIEEIGGTILEMVEIDDIELIEKAESEQQQKLFGLALSVKRGQTSRAEASPEVLKIVDSMSEKKIRDFAKTKHEGIPKKVEEELQPTTPQQFADPAIDKKKEMMDKQKLSNLKMLQQKKQQIDRQKIQMQRSGKLPLEASYQPEGEQIDERRRSEKGTPRAPRNPAFELVAKSMGTGRMGVKPRGQKKVPGKKPLAAGKYGSERRSPAQQVAINRAAAQRAQDMYKPRAGESD